MVGSRDHPLSTYEAKDRWDHLGPGQSGIFWFESLEGGQGVEILAGFWGGEAD